MTLFNTIDTVTFTTGSSGTYPSFIGTMGSFALACASQNNSLPKSMFHGMAYSSEAKLKGLWYFDENSLPRPNLANPFNMEPKF